MEVPLALEDLPRGRAMGSTVFGQRAAALLCPALSQWLRETRVGVGDLGSPLTWPMTGQMAGPPGPRSSSCPWEGWAGASLSWSLERLPCPPAPATHSPWDGS